MADWADSFFETWQRAWETGPEAVLAHVTDDVEYWDPTLTEPLRGRDAYARHVEGFFTAFTEITWSLREPVLADGDRVAEPWRCEALNSGPLWIGLPATGKRLTTTGTDLFTFRDGKVCREHSWFDVAGSLRALGLFPGLGSPGERAAFGLAGAAIELRRLVGRL